MKFIYIVKRQAARSKPYPIAEPVYEVGRRDTPEEAQALLDATPSDWCRLWIEVEQVIR